MSRIPVAILLAPLCAAACLARGDGEEPAPARAEPVIPKKESSVPVREAASRIPQLDREAPANVRTATFALG